MSKILFLKFHVNRQLAENQERYHKILVYCEAWVKKSCDREWQGTHLPNTLILNLWWKWKASVLRWGFKIGKCHAIACGLLCYKNEVRKLLFCHIYFLRKKCTRLRQKLLSCQPRLTVTCFFYKVIRDL